MGERSKGQIQGREKKSRRSRREGHSFEGHKTTAGTLGIESEVDTDVDLSGPGTRTTPDHMEAMMSTSAPADLRPLTCTCRLAPADLCPPHVLSPVIDLESKATDSDFVKHVTELFQVQAKAVVAQTAVQHLPSLKPFTGERGDKDENFH